MPNGTNDGTVLAKPCPQAECQSYNAPEAQFCAQCGTSLSAIEPVSLKAAEYEQAVGASEAPEKRCQEPHCGHANFAQAKYCAQCGKLLPAEFVEKPAPKESSEAPKGPLREIIQPFIDLAHAPRALWGVNLAYVLEGMVYFGMLGYLAIHFSDFIFQGVEHADEHSHNNVMILTAGITIAMFFLGSVADKWGVRFALIAAFMFMLVGRTFISGAPNVLGLDPARPGVFAGDRVSLYVTKMDTRDGNKAIAKAVLIANDEGAGGGGGNLTLDLAAGEGIAPSKELESRLVKLSEATVVSGEENTWKVQYGSAPITARVLTPSAEELGLCSGAVISLGNAYVTAGDEETDGDNEYTIRCHWAADFTRVDTSRCAEGAKGEAEVSGHEEIQKAKKRWPVADGGEALGTATVVNIAELRNMDDGPVNVVLRDVDVTYVRNGGYFLQSERDGPAIFAFVNPVGSPLHMVTVLGMLLVVFGYGMYQPAAYAAVRQFTTPKTAAMGFAMLYALMNLGGWLPSFAFMLRDEKWLGLGIPGTYWVYTGVTLLALFVTIVILNRKTVARAIERAKTEAAAIEAKKESQDKPKKEATPTGNPDMGARVPPVHMWILALAFLGAIYWKVSAPWSYYACAFFALLWVVLCAIPGSGRWLARHPLADSKFFYFIFALIPVQTLFAYNWLILPQYISRAFEGWIGDYFELAANANPLLIFIAVPMITAVTQKARVYNMMIYGTFIMAAPAFLLVLGPHAWALFGYLLIMTIGEAMWQPRFLQYAAEIAPEGRTGQYMGVAQLPWFLTKMLVPWLYSGWMMDRYCPAEGVRNTEIMWFYFGCIAMCSTVLLILAKGWIGKDFKTKAD